MSLRLYQQEDVQRIGAEFENGARSVLYVSPTGSGKTVVLSWIAKQLAEQGMFVGIITHLVDLIPQIAQALRKVGLDYGVIAAGYSATPALVQIISVDSYIRRDVSIVFDFMIFDEAHHVVESNKWGRALAKLPTTALFMGVTATPERTDGKGLTVFDVMVVGCSEQELIEAGYLAEPRVYAPESGIDLSNVRTTYGDYAIEDLVSIMDKPSIIGNAVKNYKEHAMGLPAIAFCISVQHTRNFAAACNASGVSAASIDGSMSKQQKAKIIKDYADGVFLILVACSLVSEGLDLQSIGGPNAWVAVGIMQRPTKSLVIWRQQCGRVMRKERPEKQFAILFDHVGNVFRHGFPQEKIDWSLEGKKARKDRAAEANILIMQCPKCYRVFKPAKECPNCGEEMKATGRKPQQTAAQKRQELKEITAEELAEKRKDFEAKRKAATTLEELYALAKTLKKADGTPYSQGWADQIYISRVGHARWQVAKKRIKEQEQTMSLLPGTEFERI